MYHCSCHERPLTGLDRGPHSRPKLFNWITTLLLIVWVLIVAVIAEISTPASADDSMSVEAFIRQFL